MIAEATGSNSLYQPVMAKDTILKWMDGWNQQRKGGLTKGPTQSTWQDTIMKCTFMQEN